MKLSRIVPMGMLLLLLMLTGEARANVVWQYTGVCDPSLFPFPHDIMCSAGTQVYIDAVVTDAYVPGTTIPINGNSHPNLISLTYRDPEITQILRDLFNIQYPLFDLQHVCISGAQLTLPSQSIPGGMIIGCSAWGLSTSTSDFWFSTELFLTHEPYGYTAYGPAGVWKQVPEPGTISLLGFAALAAAMFGARRPQRRGRCL